MELLALQSEGSVTYLGLNFQRIRPGGGFARRSRATKTKKNLGAAKTKNLFFKFG